jgi:3-deoxy-manno-octulosonate cytidylyltransferase (CMP-KDO synthetase)
MIQWVWEQVAKCTEIDKVVVATDDKRIVDVVHSFGGFAHMTESHHLSGTSRCAEVARLFPEYKIVVNVQGDEPLIDPLLLDNMLAHMKNHTEIDVYTPVHKFVDEATYIDPNAVKVILGKDGSALYFSRAPIPWLRDTHKGPVADRYKHIGIYMFKSDVLLSVSDLSHPMADDEQLEQLAWLAHGFNIYAFITNYKSIGVDTLEDAENVGRMISGR